MAKIEAISSREVGEWGPCSLEMRFLDCLLLLYLHGIVTDAESERLKDRIHEYLKSRESSDD